MWIHMVKFYPPIVFPNLVKRCEGMINERQIISPRLVLDEIRRGNDEVVEWANKHRDVFVSNSDVTVAHAANIAHDHPFLVSDGGGHDRADPYLIALALSIKGDISGDFLPLIVTEENQAGSKKIPQIAKKHEIEACNTVSMFEREGWKF